MNAKPLAVAVLSLPALLSGTASAQRLDTFAGSIDLPFDFRVVDRIDESSNSVLAFTATQRLRVAIGSGSLQGREAIVVASYALPVKGDSRDRVRTVESEPGARNARQVQLGAFPFSIHQKDDTGPAAGTTTSTLLTGSINNSMLTISIEHPASRELDASAEQSVAAFAMDFASLLQTRSRFDEAARAASSGWKMATPSGIYFVDGTTPRLYSARTEFGADGRPVASRTAYSFARAGFWSSQRMEFASACGVQGGREAIARESRIAPDSAYSRIVSQSGPMPARIGKLDATRIDSKVASTYSSLVAKSDGSRWIAVDGDTWYAFDFLSNNGSAFERDLREQIDAKPLACAPKALLVLGNGNAPPSGAP